MRKTVLSLATATALAVSSVMVPAAVSVHAVGNGPNYNGNETIKNERLHSYEDMVQFLESVDKQAEHLTVETYGQSVQGRDLFLVKFGNNPDRPTIVILTQQHGNEALVTEAALRVIQQLSTNSQKVRELQEQVNVIFIPRLNVDGAEGDVNFDISHYEGGGQATRYNANEADLNRDHNSLAQPETRALHEEVLQQYDIDYLIDFHHQGTQSAINDEYVSGSILYPTNPQVDPAVAHMSKQLGAVVYDAVEEKGYGTLGKYRGGTANTIARNGLAHDYDISTLLFEMRGMSDHSYEPYVLGQKSNGYIIQQGVVAMEAAIEAIADDSITEADTSFWETLPYQGTKGEE
ncbi:M14 family zinc carboxypeptidase [Caldalkalibacillus salinus]|uniref:M14 family zinc carboxypeptidase n=1 Tax=Caldalkalibacillus salinus TaxID=2803787 RepID=UPI001921AE85|nr:M14 family zinc carboxypeptidase [Caldalkalibacillus salinus]